jgi:PAS domain S-box-containing protein
MKQSDSPAASNASRRALRISAAYGAAGFTWILLSDLVLGRLISNPQLQTDLSIGKGLGFVAITAWMLNIVLRRSFQAHTRDAERRAEVEHELHMSDRRYRQLFETELDAILVGDIESRRIVEANPSAERLYGYSREELLGMRMEDLSDEPEESKASLLSTIEHVPLRWHRRKGGERIAVEIRATFMDLQGRRVKMGVARDITGRVKAEEARAEREREFQAIFEVASVGLAEADPETGRFLRVNEKFCAITGYASGELLTKSIREITHPDDLEANLAFVGQLLAGEANSCQFEKRYVRRNGEVAWVSLNMTTIRDALGRPVRLVAAIEEITDRKRAGVAVAEREQQLQIYVQQSPAAIAMLDRDMRYLVASRRWIEAYRLPDTPIVGMSHYELFPEIDERWKQIHRRCLAGATEKCPEDRFQRADGSVDWISWEIRPWLRADGQIGGIIIFSEDITASKRAEEALRASEERYRRLFAVETDAILLVDCESLRILDANPAAERMYGYGREEFLVLRSTDISAEPGVTAEAIAADVLHVPERRHRRKDGTIFPVEISAKTFEYGNRRVHVAAMRDITERKKAESRLLESEEFKQTILDSVSSNIAVLDTDGAILAVNARWEKSAEDNGLMRAAFGQACTVGANYIEACRKRAADGDPDARDSLEGILEVQAGRAGHYSVDYRSEAQGQRRWFTMDVTPLGKAGRVVVAHTEITDRVDAAEAVRRSEEALREGQRLAKIGTWDIDLANHGQAWSPEVYRIFARDPKLGPAGFEELPRYFTLDTWTHLAACIDTCSKEGTPYECDAEIIRGDGLRRLISVQGECVRGPDGRIGALRSTVRDITERKQAEESHARLATVVEQATESILITDTRGSIVYANPAFEKVTGYGLSELIGQNPRIIKSGKQDAAFYKGMWRALKTGQKWTGHFVNRRKDGTLFEEDATITPVRNSSGAIVNYMAIKRDVTNEVHLEGLYRQAQKMEAVGQLAGGVAHDFNNILTSMFMQIELIDLDEGLSEEIREGLRQLRADTHRAADLTKQLLLFSRRQLMQPVNLDLNEVIMNFAKMLQRIIGEDVRLQLNLNSTPLVTHADSGMLEQVLMNLAVNARDAMKGGGLLGIETTAVTVEAGGERPDPEASPGAYVAFSVRDTGGGIPPDVLPRIFEPFFTTKEAGKGTGLGLATVFGIVKQHKGWIKVDNRPGEGVTFRVHLPASKVSLQATPPEPGRRRHMGGTETILMVEDELAVRKSAVMVLERQGYRVIEAADGVEALRVWEEQGAAVDLVLTDMVMPEGLSGRDLSTRLQEGHPGLRVIFTSGYSVEMAGKELHLSRGENFIQKPFTPEQLLGIVRRSLDQDVD